MRASSALLLTAVLLAACGGSRDEGVRLRLQAVADPVEARAYRALIAAYEARRPDVRIEFIPVASQRDHMKRLTIALAGGAAPDLFLINFRRYGQFIAREVITPIGPRLARHPQFDAEAFYEPPMKAFEHQGVLQCMPQNVSSLVVYWNRALFRRFTVPEPKPDWNWKDFHDAARALTRDIDMDRRPDIFGLDLDPSIIRLAPFIWQAGGELVDDPEQPTRFALREQRAIIGLMFLKRLRTQVGVMPPLSERRAEGPDARFARGGLGMTLNSRRYTAALRAVPDLDWDVAPLPHFDKQVSVLHADAYCLASSGRHPDAATDFVVFATSAEGQALLSQSGRIVPVRREVAESPAFLDPDQRPASARVFLDAIPHLRRTPRTLNWYEIETRIDPIIEEWMFEVPAGGEREAGLVDGYRLATMIEEAAGELLAPAGQP